MAIPTHGACTWTDSQAGISPNFSAVGVRAHDGTVDKIEQIEDQTGSADPKTNFRLIVIQTELERFKFLVRSFLRTRLAKVLHHPSSIT